MVERAARLGDDVLATEIKAFAASRQYGLVFEHNRPERMRLYGKPIVVNDIVQILPKRGCPEDGYSRLLWRVLDLDETIANLEPYKTPSYIDNNCEPITVSRDRVVAIAEYDQPIYAGLKEVGRIERSENRPFHVAINGENYQALETLLFAYAGRIDCIYIDPPYNSGAHDWKYNNDYVDGTDRYRHSKWLSFMERRLRLAKKLMKESDSVLICAIDDKEVHRLGLLLEQVFPDCRIRLITTVVNPSGRAGNGFSMVEEYLFFVQMGNSTPIPWKDPMLEFEENATSSTNSRIIGGLSWESFLRSGRGNTREARKNLFYPIYIDPKTLAVVEVGRPYYGDARELPRKRGNLKIAWPIKKNGSLGIWRKQPDELVSMLDKGYAYVSSYDKKRDTFSLKYLLEGTIEAIEANKIRVERTGARGQVIGIDEYSHETLPKTVWNVKSHNAGKHGSDMLTQLLPTHNFPYPKSLYAVEDTLRFFVGNKPNALILDFFAGSGTTNHAVMRLNHQDGGTRQCISVTNNEVSETEAKLLTKRSLRQGDEDWEREGIFRRITRPRIEAAITGTTSDGMPISGDYKFTDIFPIAKGFKENAVFFDLTYQDPDAIELGRSFAEIAPLLWLRAGACGKLLEEEVSGYAIADRYAILFDYGYVREFLETIRATPKLSCVYAVTDDSARFAYIQSELPRIEVVRLYESYLRSFRIAAEDSAR